MGNSVVCGYLVLSLVPSIFHIVRSTAVKSRILLVAFDTVNKQILPIIPRQIFGCDSWKFFIINTSCLV